MSQHLDLTALIGSRICHDLISPLGAIGNGVELLTMTGGGDTPEMQLISESISAANARVRMFRIAFGAAGPGARVRLSELQDILTGLTRGSRVSVDLDGPPDLPREQAKLLLLLFQCTEAALPRGGRIIARASETGLTVAGGADVVDPKPGWFSHIDSGLGTPEPLDAAHVQFALAPIAAGEAGLSLTLECGDGVKLSANPA